MVGADLAAHLQLVDFILSLLTVQGPYEWDRAMGPLWGWGWTIAMAAMMLLVWWPGEFCRRRGDALVAAKVNPGAQIRPQKFRNQDSPVGRLVKIHSRPRNINCR